MSRRQGSTTSATVHSTSDTSRRQSGSNRLRAAGFTAAQTIPTSTHEHVDTSSHEAHASKNATLAVPHLQAQLGMALTKSLASGDLSIAISSAAEECINCANPASNKPLGPLIEECSVLSNSNSPRTLLAAHDDRSEESTAQTNNANLADEVLENDSKVLNSSSSTDEQPIGQTCDKTGICWKSTDLGDVANSSPPLVEALAALGTIESASRTTVPIEESVETCPLAASAERALGVASHAGMEPITLDAPPSKVKGWKRAALGRFFKRGLTCFA